MYKEMTIIDEEGFITEEKVLFKYEEPMFYQLKYEEKAVPYYNKILVKGRLLNEEWIETATDEEIKKHNEIIEY